MNKQAPQGLWVVLMALLGAALLSAYLWTTQLALGVDQRLHDQLTRNQTGSMAATHADASQGIVLVDIDEPSLAQLGPWPWPRTVLAELANNIRQRGAEVGFTFNPGGRGRVYNTFDAHRLLHWAGLLGADGPQYALKKALLESYQGRAECVESHEVLLAAVKAAGMDVVQAQAILESDTYGDDVRAVERCYQGAGIRSVPAIIINDRHLISGGQPVEVFEQALRKIASGAA